MSFSRCKSRSFFSALAAFSPPISKNNKKGEKKLLNGVWGEALPGEISKLN
jgi:hypothetical protein